MNIKAIKTYLMPLSGRIFYFSGMIAWLVYFVGDVIGGLVTREYSFLGNTVSEFLAFNAEYKLLLIGIFSFHALLIALFGVGIIIHNSDTISKSVLISGWLFVLIGISYILAASLFPMDEAGTRNYSTTGIMHLALVSISVVAFLVNIPLLAYSLARHKQWYSFKRFSLLCFKIIIVASVVSGLFLFEQIKLMGVTERIIGHTSSFWLCVLAHLLMKDAYYRQFGEL